MISLPTSLPGCIVLDIVIIKQSKFIKYDYLFPPAAFKAGPSTPGISYFPVYTLIRITGLFIYIMGTKKNDRK